MATRRAFAVAVALSAACAVSAGACTRGKSREERAAQQAGPAQPSALQPAAAAKPDVNDDAWLAGRLPASMAEGQPKAGGELTVGITTDPPSLNTNIDADYIASMVTSHRIYQSLINVDPLDDPNYRYVPELATSWEISPDNLTYTFHLRTGVVWHDGRPFTARDVLATLDKIQDQTTKAVHVRSYTQDLASYQAPDDFTVVLVWKKPYFLTLDTIADLPIQPAHVIGGLTGRHYNEAATNPLNRHPVGTGPFKFEKWESNTKVVLSRNEAYWGQKAHLERLVFRIQQDPTVMLQLAERGEIDIMDRVTSDQWVHMDSPALRKHWHRSKFYSANYGFIGWNQERPMFADKRVRRALTMLVDRPGVIEKMLHGLPKATTCHFY
jgi:peptide/nickel transport system substrate-binding protein